MVDDQYVFWGDCLVDVERDLAEYSNFSDTANFIETVDAIVRPVLQGQQLDSFQALCQHVEALRETVSYDVVTPAPIPEPKTNGAVSRRDLISGNILGLGATKEAPKDIVEQVTERRALHPGLRYGLSAALLGAVAHVNRQSAVEVLANEYSLPIADAPLAIHIELIGSRLSSDDLLNYPIDALGYTQFVVNAREEMGANGERIQAYARQLKARLQDTLPPDTNICLQLNTDGGWGQLKDNNTGKLLGALSGLSHATKPFSVRLVSPFNCKTVEEDIDKMKDLTQFIRFRKINAELVAKRNITSLEMVKRYAEKKAGNVMQLNPLLLGTIDQTLQAVQVCHTHDIAVLLGSTRTASDRSSEILAALALVAQPRAVIQTNQTVHPDMFPAYAAMSKITTWRNYRQSQA